MSNFYLSHGLFSLKNYLSSFVPWKTVNMQKISLTKICFLRLFLMFCFTFFCYNWKLTINFELQLCTKADLYMSRFWTKKNHFLGGTFSPLIEKSVWKNLVLRIKHFSPTDRTVHEDREATSNGKYSRECRGTCFGRDSGRFLSHFLFTKWFLTKLPQWRLDKKPVNMQKQVS